jgi:hypothetical protein
MSQRKRFSVETFNCLKFELYLPAEYTDRKTGKKRSLSFKSIEDLSNELQQTYGGYTEANLMGPPPYRGYWQGEVDYSYFINVIVPLEREDECTERLARWKRRLEKRLNQQFVLITIQQLSTIGSLTGI